MLTVLLPSDHTNSPSGSSKIPAGRASFLSAQANGFADMVPLVAKTPDTYPQSGQVAHAARPLYGWLGQIQRVSLGLPTMALARLGLLLGLYVGMSCVAMSVMPAQARDVELVGTGDGLEIFLALAKDFERRIPGDRLVVPPSIGSGGAIAGVASGQNELGRVARPLSANEQAAGMVYTPIFRLPTVFYVHPALNVRSLSVQHLAAIFDGSVTNWSQVGGPDLRIRVVRREDADSSVAVLRTAFPEFTQLKFSPYAKLARTTQEAFEAVVDNPGAIGFGPFSRAQAEKTRVLAINGVPPSNPAYPAFVTLAIIHKSAPLDGAAMRVVEYLKSAEASVVLRDFGALSSR